MPRHIGYLVLLFCYEHHSLQLSSLLFMSRPLCTGPFLTRLVVGIVLRIHLVCMIVLSVPVRLVIGVQLIGVVVSVLLILATSSGHFILRVFGLN